MSRKNSKKSLASKAWLMWIGTEFYPTIESWANEAVELGVSKRLPNGALGEALMEPGNVVFVAHDEGEKIECPDCLGTIECPDCRRLTTAAGNLFQEIKEKKKTFRGVWETDAPRAFKHYVELRERKIRELRERCGACQTCKGKNQISRFGTGGYVVLPDGEHWDYRRYNYWLHQPSKFSIPEEAIEKHMCESCGGTGRRPCGRIFGMFVPERIEYIDKGDETEEYLKSLKHHRFVLEHDTKKEKKRRCGYRKPGGFYAVTGIEESILDPELVSELKKKGFEFEISGSFFKFKFPRKIEEKRFRGMKQIKMGSIDKKLWAQVELILEALQD